MPRKSKSDYKQKPQEIFFKIDGSVYGQVIKILGDCNFMVFCFDGKERLCHIRKSIKKQIVSMDSFVLVGLRDYQDDKGDIIFVYSREHVAQLKKMKEIPNMSISQNEYEEQIVEDDTGFDFDTI